MIDFKFKRKNLKFDHGYSLIETMVALSIFTIVMTVAMGSLLTIIGANKKSQAIQSLMTNLNFVIDDITRNARVSTTYHCSDASLGDNVSVATNCPSGDTAFAFEEPRGDGGTSSDQIVFRYNSGAIEKSTNGGSTYNTVTSSDITITNMKFYVTGATSADSVQPKVLIVLQGTAGNDDAETDFDIQTTITQRLLDN